MRALPDLSQNIMKLYTQCQNSQLYPAISIRTFPLILCIKLIKNTLCFNFGRFDGHFLENVNYKYITSDIRIADFKLIFYEFNMKTPFYQPSELLLNCFL